MELDHPLAAVTFWACLGLVVYAYAGYPVLVWCLARLFGRRGRPADPADADVPAVSLLIAAYNEEAVIEDRLRNALALDYPADKLEIVVASDGSTDGTAAAVRRYADRGVRLLDYALRRGKAAVLNSAVGELRHEVVAFSDANTHFDTPALRRLVRGFADPAVGVVCGRLVLTDGQGGRNADGLYWKYETFLKAQEARLGALLGANGAIYGLRRELYTPVPDDTIVDDLVIPLLARLRTGCGVAYEPEAVAREETAADVGAEFRRRARIGAGGFQSVGLLGRLLDPRQGWLAFTFVSHKLLRWLCPFFLVGLAVSNLWLAGEAAIYQWALAGQAGFYAASALAARLPAGPRALRVLRLTALFTGMNLALLVGFWRWLRGSQQAAWARTARLAEALRLAEIQQTVP